MPVDGSLIFNTKMDTSGFSKGTKQISSKVVELKNKISASESEIANLRQELEKMADTPIKSNVTEKLEKDIVKAKNQLKSLYAEADRIGNAKQSNLTSMGFGTEYLDDMLSQDTGWQKVQKQIDETEAKLQEYERELKQVKASESKFTGKDTAEYAKKKRKLDELTGQLNVYKAKLRETQDKERGSSRTVKSSVAALNAMSKKLKEIYSRLKKAFTKTVLDRIKKLGNSTARTNKQMGLLSKSIARIKQALAGLLLYKILQGVIDSIKEGINSLAKASPQANKNLSALMTSLEYLRNSLATAFAPILNVVTPILTGFIDTLSATTDKIAQFIATLMGESTYTKAIKVQKNYAESLDESTDSTKKNTEATEENQKSLAGYDELNIMQSDTSSIENTDTTENETVFVSVPTVFSNFATRLKEAIEKQDFSTVGQLVADKFNKALLNINWAKIKITAKKWASNIANFLNGFIKKTDWKLIGKTLALAINTAIGFVNGFSFDWDGLGEALRNALIGFIENFDTDGAISAFTGLINGLVTTAITFIGIPDFTEWGKNVIKGIKNTLQQINWDNVSSLFSTLIIGALDFVDGMILEIDWEELGNNIVSSFKSFFNEGGNGYNIIKSLGQTFYDLFFGILTSLDTIANGTDWEKFGENLSKLFTVDTSDESWQNKLAKTASDIVNALLDFINGVFSDPKSADKFAYGFSTMLGNIDWEAIFMKALSAILNISSWLTQLAVDLIVAFCEGLATGFSAGEDDELLNEAITGFGKAIGNLLLTTLEALLKIIVNAIPNFILGLLKIIYSLFANVCRLFLGDEWYNSVTEDLYGPNSFRFDIPVNLPRLATGTVVPANYGEFLAVLGDNKREAEIVSPISAMKQAFLEAIAEGGFNSGNGQPEEINIYIDGDKVFNVVVNRNNSYKKTHGQSALI